MWVDSAGASVPTRPWPSWWGRRPCLPPAARPGVAHGKLSIGTEIKGWIEVSHSRNESGSFAYRRRLPHYREKGATYFLTWRVAPGSAELDHSERSIVAQAICHFADIRYELLAYVVMNDHAHVLLRPFDPFELKNIVHSWKSYSAWRMQRETARTGTVWQDEYFDRIIRDHKELEEKANYIADNPYRRWPELQDYQWMWP